MDQRSLEVLSCIVECIIVAHQRETLIAQAFRIERIADPLRLLEGGIALDELTVVMQQHPPFQ